MLRYCCTLLFLASCLYTHASSLLIPMDEAQQNHLKAYGITFYALQQGMTAEWLLNYRGGSFLIPYSESLAGECLVRGVTFVQLPDEKVYHIKQEISLPEVNMHVVKMERAPRIAVYSPKNELIADETDAVIAVLDYAEIPYTILYDEKVLQGALMEYDWLHLHHEDFTGQIHRFRWRESAVAEAQLQMATARQLGFVSVAAMKAEVVRKISGFCAAGGYIFAMCSGAETFDIALAAEGKDVNPEFTEDDETGSPPVLNFDKSFAFENFDLEYDRRFSTINTGRTNYYDATESFFTLFNFSAKWDIVPSVLTQNHEQIIKEFFGQTTAFDKDLVKSEALILGENSADKKVRYIYGEFGRGHWTYYSGHDPERAPGRWTEQGINLDLYPHSAGYRLILNNVLFPSAQKKKQKT